MIHPLTGLLFYKMSASSKQKQKQTKTDSAVLTRVIKFRHTEGNNIDTQQIITFIQ